MWWIFIVHYWKFNALLPIRMSSITDICYITDSCWSWSVLCCVSKLYIHSRTVTNSYIMFYHSLSSSCISSTISLLTLDPLLLFPTLLSKDLWKQTSCFGPSSSRQQDSAGFRMRVTSSLFLALLVLLLLPSVEMKRSGKGRGLRGARHKLTRDRYRFPL